jgi:branched-chain amino acid transport system substrate-binding protein
MKNTKIKMICVLPLIVSVAFSFQPRALAAEDGVTADSILIGQSLPMTGQSASRGLEVKAGSDLFLKKLNAAGGVLGRKINVRAVDDVFLPEKTYSNCKALIEDDKVFALFEIYGGPTNKAIMGLVEKSGVPLIAPVTGSDFLRTPVQASIFGVKASNSDEAMAMVKYAVEKKKVKEFGVFYQRDAFGDSGMAASLVAFEKFGAKRVSQAFFERSATDIKQGFDQVMEAKPKGVIIWSADEQTILFAEKAATLNSKPLILSYSSAHTEKTIEASKKFKDFEFYVGQGVPYLVEKPTELHKLYEEEAKAAGLKSGPNGFEGYLNAAFLAEAIKRTGKVLTRENLKKTIETSGEFDIGGIKLNFSATKHFGIASSSVVMIKNGKRTAAE